MTELLYCEIAKISIFVAYIPLVYLILHDSARYVYSFVTETPFSSCAFAEFLLSLDNPIIPLVMLIGPFLFALVWPAEIVAVLVIIGMFVGRHIHRMKEEE